MKLHKSSSQPGLYYFACPSGGHYHYIPTQHPQGNGAMWGFNGDVDKPTFSPSILMKTGKHADPQFDDEGYKISEICHSFVRDGWITFLDDCTHGLKGQTVELFDINEEHDKPAG